MTPPQTTPSVRRRNRRLLAVIASFPAVSLMAMHGPDAVYATANMMLAGALLVLALYVLPNLHQTTLTTRITGGVFLLAMGIWHADLARRAVTDGGAIEPTTLSIVALAVMCASGWGCVLWGGLTNLDMVERQVYEDRVVSLVRQLDMAQAVTGIGSYEWVPKTGHMVASSQMFVIFGMEPTDGVDRADFERHIHPEDRPTYRTAVRHALDEGTGWDLYYRVGRDLDGRERIIHGRGRCIVDAHGRVEHVIGTVQDVTERRASDRRRRAGDRTTV